MLTLKYSKSLLHRIHLYAEGGIGAFAVITFLFGDALFSSWVHVDMFFHITIAVVAFGSIIAERVLHKHKHDGMIN